MAHTADYPKDGSTLENGKARTASAPGQVRPRYLLSLFSGLFGALVVFCLTLLVLDRTGNLPPPAFSNISCADEKLSFMRGNRPRGVAGNRRGTLIANAKIVYGSTGRGTFSRSRPLPQTVCGCQCDSRAS